MTVRFSIIENKIWKNVVTGQLASIYGAVPYHSEKESENWIMVTNGYCVKDNIDNIVGFGSRAFKSKSEAEEKIKKLNELFGIDDTASN